MDVLQSLEKKLERAVVETGLSEKGPTFESNGIGIPENVNPYFSKEIITDIPPQFLENGDVLKIFKESKHGSARAAIDSLLSSERVLRPLRSLIKLAFVKNPARFSLSFGELMSELVEEERKIGGEGGSELFSLEKKLVELGCDEAHNYLQVDMLEVELANLISSCTLPDDLTPVAIEQSSTWTDVKLLAESEDNFIESKIELNPNSTSNFENGEGATISGQASPDHLFEQTMLFWKEGSRKIASEKMKGSGGSSKVMNDSTGLHWQTLENYYKEGRRPSEIEARKGKKIKKSEINETRKIAPKSRKRRTGLDQLRVSQVSAVGSGQCISMTTSKSDSNAKAIKEKGTARSHLSNSVKSTSSSSRSISKKTKKVGSIVLKDFTLREKKSSRSKQQKGLDRLMRPTACSRAGAYQGS